MVGRESRESGEAALQMVLLLVVRDRRAVSVEPRSVREVSSSTSDGLWKEEGTRVCRRDRRRLGVEGGEEAMARTRLEDKEQ